MLSREDILNVTDIEIEEVEVPEWGGTVFVKGLTGTERDAYESSMIENRGKNRAMNLENLRAKLAVMTICDQEGKRLFTERDVKKLGEKSASALQRVFKVAQRLSGLTEEDVDELSKNSQEEIDSSISD